MANTTSSNSPDVVIPVAPEKPSAEKAAEVADTGFTVGTEESAQGRTFSEAEVAEVRKQEKDKMYKRLSDSDTRVQGMQEQIDLLNKERDAAAAEAAGKQEEAARVLKEREEAELSAKELIGIREDEFNAKFKAMDEEWQSKLSAIETAREQEAAVIARERELIELQTFTTQAMQQAEANIIPELRDLVSGNTPDEVANSIALLTERSSAILDSVRQSTQSGRRGPAVTSPPVGPMETQSEQQTLSADDIRNMPMDQYVQMRDRLMTAAKGPQGRF